MEVRKEQLNILLHAMKDVVQTKNCPDWVAAKLNKAVKEAKEFKVQEEPTADLMEYIPVEVGGLCQSNVANDPCTYKVLEESDTVQGVRLFHIQIMKGNKQNPPGTIIHNVPMDRLIGVKNV